MKNSKKVKKSEKKMPRCHAYINLMLSIYYSITYINIKRGI
jgi:hypothetical protein